MLAVNHGEYRDDSGDRRASALHDVAADPPALDRHGAGLGGEFRARFFDGWEGTGRIDVCEPPRHLLVMTRHVRQVDEHAAEVTLTADGDHTILILEERGMPVSLLADYGAGIQVHIEDLAAHISGQERCDLEARWQELKPSYEALAAQLG